MPELMQGAPGSRFGFQVQASVPPSYVGSQPLHKYEQDQIKHKAQHASGRSAPQARQKAAPAVKATLESGLCADLPRTLAQSQANSPLPASTLCVPQQPLPNASSLQLQTAPVPGRPSQLLTSAARSVPPLTTARLTSTIAATPRFTSTPHLVTTRGSPSTAMSATNRSQVAQAASLLSQTHLPADEPPYMAPGVRQQNYSSELSSIASDEEVPDAAEDNEQMSSNLEFRTVFKHGNSDNNDDGSLYSPVGQQSKTVVSVGGHEGPMGCENSPTDFLIPHISQIHQGATYTPSGQEHYVNNDMDVDGPDVDNEDDDVDFYSRGYHRSSTRNANAISSSRPSKSQCIPAQPQFPSQQPVLAQQHVPIQQRVPSQQHVSSQQSVSSQCPPSQQFTFQQCLPPQSCIPQQQTIPSRQQQPVPPQQCTTSHDREPLPQQPVPQQRIPSQQRTPSVRPPPPPPQQHSRSSPPSQSDSSSANGNGNDDPQSRRSHRVGDEIRTRPAPNTHASPPKQASEEPTDSDSATAVSTHGWNRRGGKYSKNAKGSIPAKPTTLAFFGPLWTKLLDAAKARMRLYIATEELFLWIEVTVDGQCSEVLIETIVHYEQNNFEVEAGYYPLHKRSMARLLFNDTQTFRSEIKKLAQCVIPLEYHLQAPPSAKTEAEHIHTIKDKAADLIQDSAFLLGERDEQDKASNFAHSTLKNICLAIFYSNATKALCQFIEFQSFVPYKALVLIAAMVHGVLCAFKKHGFDKSQSFNVDEAEDSYDKMINLINHVIVHPYHGPKLNVMLEDWASIGMTGYVAKGHAKEASDSNWTVVLD
ncbi:hypothetical protein HYDPIDRAFT_28030 [Hydnomerulius pinastri MD-312]|uniref:DUF6532 domain-containing protein n=1 Tax=Hydnomerulius pinastri MD-312 TaxID=994086 RepID=A0A0C9VI15_9AGAM|nr:hypothetical protein HYDPIDRAFT_28030 [Hydnomerulius pinastri MD-312]